MMCEYDDLVKRLNSGVVSSGLMREAAKAIEALEDKIKRLEYREATAGFRSKYGEG